MKIKFVVFASICCLTGFSQENTKELDKPIKNKLTNHSLSIDGQLIGSDDQNFEYSYRYYLNDKWNLKASADFSRYYSNRYNRVLEIVNFEEYLDKESRNYDTQNSFNLGVERNFNKGKLIPFVGAEIRYAFNSSYKTESIVNYKVNSDVGYFYYDSLIGTYSQVDRYSSIGFAATVGMKYNLSRRFSVLIKLKGSYDKHLSNFNTQVSDNYYEVNGIPKSTFRTIYTDFIECRLDVGLLFRI